MKLRDSRPPRPSLTPSTRSDRSRARRVRAFWELCAGKLVLVAWLAGPLLFAARPDAEPLIAACMLLGTLMFIGTVLLRLRAMGHELGAELTEHDQVKRRLRLHEAQSQALLNALPDLIFRVADDGTVSGVAGSARTHALSGAVQLEQLVPGDVARELLSQARDVQNSGLLGRIEYQKRDGDEPLDFELRVARCDDRQVVVMLRQVTQRKRLERELIAAREGALEAARLKTKFLANMSHEIRTPMNGVIGMTNLLLETPLTSEQHEYAQIIQKSGQALLSIIDDILDFAKIEAGKLELDDVEFELGACVDDSLEAVAAQAEAKGLELGAVFADGVTSRVRGDPTRLRQVLANLLSNAVRYTERGHVLVRVDHAADCDDAVLLAFSVEDSGPGIAEEARAALFQPVLLSDGGPLSAGGGAGLGLAIARELVQLMGGEIAFRPAPGGGSTFAFTARIIPRELGRSSLEPGALQQGAARVLLVAPDELAVWAIEPQLAALGLRSERVSPLQLAHSAARAPCLALIVDARCDLQRLLVNLGELRRDTQGRSIPLVLVARADLDDASPVRAEATRVLRWPVRQSELRACLLALLTRTREPAQVVPPPRKLSAHVLVADDDPINQRVLRRTLTQLGCTCELVDDGAQAVERALESRFDVILMDVQMPVLDGFSAARALRAREPVERRNRIVAVTASSEDDDKRHSREAQMDAFLTKPVSADQLRELLCRMLSPGGDEEALTLAQAATFLEQAPRNLDAMAAALDVGDFAAVARAAQNLASTSASLGADRLSSLCADLSAAAHGERLSSTERGLEAVRAELDGIRRRLSAPLVATHGSAL